MKLYSFYSPFFSYAKISIFFDVTTNGDYDNQVGEGSYIPLFQHINSTSSPLFPPILSP